MKKLIFVCLLFCFQVIVAQTDADYESTLKNIMASYNAKDAQKIFDKFSTDLQESYPLDKLKTFLTKTLEDQGKFSEFDFMDIDGGHRYLVQSENDSIIIVIELSVDLKLTKFTNE